MSDKTLLQQANHAFRSKKYELSVNLYHEIINANPEIEPIIKFNLNLAKSKIKYDIDIVSDERSEIQVVLFNTNFQTKNLHITSSIRKALQRHKRVKKCVYSNFFTLVDDCKKTNPDLLICIDGQNINQEILGRARNYARKTILWTFDDPYTTRDSIKSQDLFDVIFSNDKSSVSAYDKPAFHLPLAAHLVEDFCSKYEEPVKARYDIFFCGTAWPNRVDLLNKLLSLRPGLNYKISMPYNKYVPGTPLISRPISSYVQPLNFIDFIKSCKESKIVLGLHRVFGENHKMQSSTTPGPRVFEVAGCRSFQLAEKDIGVENYFNTDTEIPVYGGLEDLLDKIDFYLENENERRALAENSYKNVMSSHTYSNRIDFIFSKIRFDLQANNKDDKFPVTYKPKLLYVVHNTINSPPFGGLEIHQDILAKNLKDKYDIYFLYSTSTQDNSGRKFLLTDSKYNEILSTQGSKNDYHSHLSDRKIEKWFSQILCSFNFSLIHFFHFMNNVPSLAFIAKSLGIPYVISIHDFYIGCRSFNLINHEGEYCIAEVDTNKCDVCLASKFKIPYGSQTIRRSFYREILEKASCLIYMSPSTKKIVEKLYPSLEKHEYPRTHGAPLPAVTPENYRRENRSSQLDRTKLHIVVPGNLALHKGGVYLIKAMNGLSTEPLMFHFWGNIDKNLELQLTTRFSDLTCFHGSYSPGSLPYNKYDISLHLSIWPETYCQTLSEAWAARLVPVCTDIGAFSDRVTDGVNGILVDYKKPETLTYTIRDLVRNSGKIDKIKRAISDRLFIDQQQHSAMYDEVYAKVAVTEFSTSTAYTAKNVVSKEAGFGLHEIQIVLKKSAWYNVGVQHPEDELILPNSR